MSRQVILNYFAGTKRISRFLLREIEYVCDSLREISKRIRHAEACVEKLEEHLPFTQHRIDELRDIIAEMEELSDREEVLLDKLRGRLADEGERLRMACDAAEELLSEQEKAQIVGIHHDVFERLRKEYADKGLSLFELIACRHAEYESAKTREYRRLGFVPSWSVEMPLWNIASEAMFRAVMERPKDFRKIFNQVFHDVPMFRLEQAPDGTTVAKPYFKVLDGGKS